MNDAEKEGASTLAKVVNIVAAYVGHNSLRAADLPDLIASVHASISGLSPSLQSADTKQPENPAVSIKKSVTKDHIVCLEDGKKFKSLRRHLSSFHNLTPEAYRAKWGLANDYPMVAPAYSATRSQLAKESGLGQIGKIEPPKVEKPKPGPGKSAKVAEAPSKKAGRGRPRKTAA